jgi:predicted HTH domain antitoxin
METVNVALPLALLKAANLEEKNISQEAARLLALELYREEKVSLGRAAELCQTPLAEFLDFVAKHGVPPLRYSFEDLQEEQGS